jgi:hypothetical protein
MSNSQLRMLRVVGAARKLIPEINQLQSALDEYYNFLPPTLFTTWMCQVGAQSPMPAPNEDIAREWAKRSNGRAFRVVEALE